jgi:ABC-2 type transport system permease protein
MTGLWKLTWLEVKIFVREPLGFVGSVGLPVLLFLVLARTLGRGPARVRPAPGGFGPMVPAFSALFISLSAVVSLVTIVSIYRESGILKRLRATPLRPHVILTAHVIVKLLLTAFTLALMVLAGRRVYPIGPEVPLVSFSIAVLFTTWSVLSMGFVLASLVPTARFAQPITALVLYPMIAVSGLFFPVSVLPPAVASVVRVLPLTAAASLLAGTWRGDSWLAHGPDVLILVATFCLCMALSARVFRWE